MAHLRLEVTMARIEPPIWRLVEVPSNYTLADLHRILQVLIGWEDCHLHEFRAGKKVYAPLGDGDFEMGPSEDTNGVTLEQVFKEVPTLMYHYDFGDGWVVAVTKKPVGEPVDGAYPRCLDGKRAGPLEDCGGVGGYQDCVKAASGNSKDPERLEWCDDWDPEFFDRDVVNERLKKFFLRRSRG